MDIFSSENVGKLLDQGAALILALVMFIVWMQHVKRLEGILRERKTDRDAMLTMLGKLETHLARADGFETFAREALRQQGDSTHPHRRDLDKRLAEALARVNEDRT
jgi:hypothetical protein